MVPESARARGWRGALTVHESRLGECRSFAARRGRVAEVRRSSPGSFPIVKLEWLRNVLRVWKMLAVVLLSRKWC